MSNNNFQIPAINLSEARNVRIALNHYFNFYNFDYAQINISTDGSEWITVYKFWSNQGGPAFQLFEYDITDLAASEEEVYIQFLFNDLSR